MMDVCAEIDESLNQELEWNQMYGLFWSLGQIV